jgi:hypothetical protein
VRWWQQETVASRGATSVPFKYEIEFRRTHLHTVGCHARGKEGKGTETEAVAWGTYWIRRTPPYIFREKVGNHDQLAVI